MCILIYSSSQFRPAIFHILDDHQWLVTTILSIVSLDDRSSHIQSDLQQLKLCLYLIKFMFSALFSLIPSPTPFLLDEGLGQACFARVGSFSYQGIERRDFFVGAIHGTVVKILKVHLLISNQVKVLNSELNPAIYILPFYRKVGRNVISFVLERILLCKDNLLM